MNCLVSVIIPVHDVEDYLRQTLRSVAEQSLTEIEVICVDDGSIDGSADIVRECVEKDSRFVLIQQPALGAGEARNRGLSCASGEYVVFLDADDFFESCFLEKMYRQIKLDDADVCMCGAMSYDCESGRETINRSVLKAAYLPKKKKFSAADCPETLFLVTSPAPWSKLYRRRFLEEKGLLFQSLSNSNDLFFYVASFASATSITYVEDRLVHYRQGRPGSLQNANRIHNPDNFARALDESCKYLVEKGMLDRLSVAFGEFASSMVAYNLNTAKGLEAHQKTYEAARKFVIEYVALCARRGLDAGGKLKPLLARLDQASYAEFLYQEFIAEKKKKAELADELKLIKSKKRINVLRKVKRLAKKILPGA